MELNAVHKHVLGLAVEDWYALFELLHRDVTAPPELRSVANQRHLLIRTLEDLIDAGLVTIAVGQPTGVPTAVSREQGRSLVAQGSCWEEPAPGQSVTKVGATALGERLYYEVSSNARPS